MDPIDSRFNPSFPLFQGSESGCPWLWLRSRVSRGMEVFMLPPLTQGVTLSFQGAFTISGCGVQEFFPNENNKTLGANEGCGCDQQESSAFIHTDYDSAAQCRSAHSSESPDNSVGYPSLFIHANRPFPTSVIVFHPCNRSWSLWLQHLMVPPLYWRRESPVSRARCV